MKVLGLDEAGRGCVLGPLVVGGFCCEDDQFDALTAAGADDSKALSKKKRVAAMPKLELLGRWKLEFVEPADIDAGNMNTLEERAFARLIEHFQPDHVIIDAPVHPRGVPNFEKRLRALLSVQPTMRIEPKADANYAPVGAASIFAKVHRDERIAELGDVGSGYPSDPKTRAWLKGFIARDEPFPASVRTRWGTIDNLRAEQQALF